jgi:hypothetical protein
MTSQHPPSNALPKISKQPPSKYADEQAAELKSSAEKTAEKDERKRKREENAKASGKKLTTNDYNAAIEDVSNDPDSDEKVSSEDDSK